MRSGPLHSGKMEIQSRDGVSSRISVFEASDPSAAVLVCMPAMGVKAGFYEPLARELARRGWNVILSDLRGHGESRVRAAKGVDFGYHEMVAHDWPAVMEKARQCFPDAPMVLFGHSLGGQLSALHMSENPGEVAALIMVAAPSLFYRGWPFPRCLTILFLTHFFFMISLLLGYFPGNRFGVGSREAKSLMRGWARVARTGRYRLIHSETDYDALLARLEVPVLSISFSDDGLYAPKRAVDRFCEKLSSAKVTRLHLAPEDLSCDALGHFGWIKQSQALAEILSGWLALVLKGRPGFPAP